MKLLCKRCVDFRARHSRLVYWYVRQRAPAQPVVRLDSYVNIFYPSRGDCVFVAVCVSVCVCLCVLPSVCLCAKYLKKL